MGGFPPKLPVRARNETGDVVVDVQEIIVPDASLEGNGAVDLASQLAAKANKAWTVVSSASASVSPTAADSGKYYRLSHANPTFNLPTTDLVVGETEFWVSFVGGAAPTGTVDAGTGKTVDQAEYDVSDGDFTGSAAQTATPLVTFKLFHLKYVATNVWTSDIVTQIA